MIKKLKYPITYEILPPRGIDHKSIESLIPITKYLEAVTITDNPIATLRASSICYGYIAKDILNIKVIPNISCRDRNLLSLQSDILGVCLLGYKNVYIITGDAPNNKENFKGVWEVNSIDLCKVVKGFNSGQTNVRGISTQLTNNINLIVGGAIIFDRSFELTTYYKKVDVGFDYFITQITYDSDQVIKFYSDAENYGCPINKHVQIGIAPTSLKKFHNISKMSGIYIPENIKNRLENSINYQEDMLSMLLELVDDLKTNLKRYSIGFHIMPIGSNDIGIKLVEELK